MSRPTPNPDRWGPRFSLEGGRAQLIQAQRHDDSLHHCRQKAILSKAPFSFDDGLLVRLWTPPHGREEVQQIVLPRKYRETTARMGHSTPFAGHFGRRKTLHRIQTSFFWPGMNMDIANLCRSCEACQKTAHLRTPKYPLVPLPVIETPFSRMAMDMIGPLPATSLGHKYILTVCDYSTRYPEAIPLQTTTSIDVAKALVSIFARTGIPTEILTDRGSNFCSQLMEDFYKLLGIRHIQTSAYHPETDGLVERFNGTLKHGLKKFLSTTGTNWHESLPYILFAYRELPHSSTGHSPFELLYGRNPRGPLDILKEEWAEPPSQQKDVVTFLTDTYRKLEQAHLSAKSNESAAKEDMAHYYNKRSKMRSLKPADLVLVLLPSDTNKLQAQWQGPFPVLEKLSPTTYRVQTGHQKNQIKTLHINMLTEWQSPSAVCLLTLKTDAERLLEETQEQEDDFPSYRADSTHWDSKIDPQLPPDQKKELLQLLHKYKNVFSDLPGLTTRTSISIDTKDAQPVVSAPYRVPHAFIQEFKEEIADMLRLKIITPSTSPWASPALHVAKKDGTKRLCVDYKKLNRISVSDPYPMPRIEDMIDDLSSAKYISTIDLTKGYWQVPVEPDSRAKTSFILPFGKFEYLTMPFGLAGAPAVFQRLMDSLLSDLSGHVAAYMDDIVIFSTTWQDHLHYLELTIKRLSDAGLTLKLPKCQFAMESCLFLGHEVGNSVIKPLTAKIDAVANYKKPVTKKDVLAFLGLTGYYRRFIPMYASIAAPLSDATRKEHPNKVLWTEAANEAFSTLKQALSQEPVLQAPRIGETFCIQTDASLRGIGGVLSQKDELGRDRPIAYFSKKFNAAEQKYATVEQECLAIVRTIQHFRPYLAGVPFEVETDHACLRFLHAFKDTNSKLTRWALLLQEYSFSVRHKPGVKNGNADGLSRQAWDATPLSPTTPSVQPLPEGEECYGPREGCPGQTL